jgi:hypothetical protein
MTNMYILWARRLALYGESSWLTTVGLGVVLGLLLAGGVVLLAMGLSNLVRDWWRHPYVSK